MIVTFTDFGIEGPYLGQMKAKLIEYAPHIPIVDLMVDVPAYHIRSGATLLAAFVEQFPQDTVFLSVVDPDVGSSRKPICIKCDGQWFVGPDNGLFEYVIKKAKSVEAFEVLWRPKMLSHSFHGRDLFAPIAAQLARGEDFEKNMIEPLDLVSLAHTSDWEIIYIDHYGNCWLNVRCEDIDESIVFSINNTNICYARVFAESEIGKPFWYINSSGFVELAINQGNMQNILTLKVGDLVEKPHKIGR